MKLIILDRDGVINEDSDDFIKSPDEWNPIPGSLEAIVRLNQAGYRVTIATNQSGLARGLLDMHTLNRIHDKMRQHLNLLGGNIESIFFCPHGPDDGCTCRKPSPGLLQDTARRLNTSLHNVPVVGDSLRDIQAAQRVGAKPYLVKTGKGQRTLAKSKEKLQQVEIYDDLSAVVDALLK